MKCRRETCHRKAGHGGRNRGLCDAHYRLVPRGYVDAAPSSERLKALNGQGFSWRQLAEMTGMTEQGLYRVRDGERVQVITEKRILALPLPDPYAGRGRVDSFGIQRRVRALVALGWPQRALEARLGISARRLSTVLSRPQIYTSLARRICGLYEELSMTLGPSERSRTIARRKGWAVPLCWDDIDDPDESPNVGVVEHVSASERIAELHDLGVRDVHQIAERLGVKAESVERQLMREKAA